MWKLKEDAENEVEAKEALGNMVEKIRKWK